MGIILRKGKLRMEIERKYLVHPAKFNRQELTLRANVIMRIQQGYFTVKENVSMRVRLIELNKDRYGTTFDEPWKGSITLKTKEAGPSRHECEGITSYADAEIFMKMCTNKILKDRFIYYFENVIWEIDDFGPPHEELIIAEIEIPNVDTRIEKPDWIGEEVTARREFYSENLNSREYIPHLEKFLGWKIPE
jgi:CYTH domain-containing protein